MNQYEPCNFNGGGRVWMFHELRAGDPPHPAFLPAEIFRRLQPHKIGKWGGTVSYPTREAALSALAEALASQEVPGE